MYIYKSEILMTDTKWFSDKADLGDLARLDELINKRTAEGWEFVTYNYMSTSLQLKGAFIVTFRRENK